MQKYVAFSAVAGFALAFTLWSARVGAEDAPASTCKLVETDEYYYAVRLAYDKSTGLRVSFHTDFDHDSITAHIRKQTDGTTNVDFDRLYALALKGYETNGIETICFDASNEVTSISLRSASIKKVQVCDYSGSCAYVSTGQLYTQ